MQARRGDVIDDYHGKLVADPYRWLENPDDPETLAWVVAQNTATEAFIAAEDQRDAIVKQLTDRWDYPKYGLPTRRGELYFYAFNCGLQNQAVIYAMPRGGEAPHALIDPNTLAEDGTAALTGLGFSRDGAYVAYGVAEHGSDWQAYRVRRVSDGVDLEDTIRHCKFTNTAWAPDGSGFYYDRFPDPATVPPEEQSLNNRVYWHRLGTSQAADQLIYAQPEAPRLGFSPDITFDGDYLILTVWEGTDPRNRFFYRPLASDGDFIRLLDDFDASYQYIANDGPIFYFLTTQDAPRRRIIAIDLRAPEREQWREIIPQSADTIEFAALIHDQFVVASLHNVHHVLRRYDHSGRDLGEIVLPGIGALLGITGRPEDDECFIQYTSFLQPPTVYRFDFTIAAITPWPSEEAASLPGDFDPSAFETIQIFYPSRDGTMIPMFLTYRRGIAQDGSHPTLLYGYGGFNISLTPAFSPTVRFWLEQGGIYAVANLRGGGEYGEEWHAAGTLERKQNVFDDFIAAAEWLIAQGYTSHERLAIEGGSNGGLLVAACEAQRPDLFGAVICRVPVIDMLRYHRFTVGRYWVSDYGNAEEDPEHFRFMLAYSPLHNIRQGVAYPPTLILSADTDDRVVPAHAKKFAAALQWANAGPHPILLRVDLKAGHGLGKPTAKLIAEQADKFAFLFRILHVDSPTSPTRL